MATSNRGGNRGGGNRGRRGHNNHSEGRGEQSSGWVDSARERPFTAAAAIGGAVAAGVFLWSRRNQISDQIANLSDQISEWREGSGFENATATDSGMGESFMARSARSGARKSQSEIAEEAMSLEETGKKGKSSADAIIEEQTATGAVAY